MTNNDARGIVRYLQEDGDRERDFPCFVAHKAVGGPCERPAAIMVYGLPFCEVHGEEARDGALEELHQDAGDFFERLDNPHVPDLSNPLVLRAVRDWRLTVPEDLAYSDEQTEELLLRAFPFREDGVIPETAGEIADPIPDQDPLTTRGATTVTRFTNSCAMPGG